MAYTILIVSARFIQGNTDEHQIKNCVFIQGMILIKKYACMKIIMSKPRFWSYFAVNSC